MTITTHPLNRAAAKDSVERHRLAMFTDAEVADITANEKRFADALLQKELEKVAL